MSKLILNEKLTLEEKLTLDEKLILDEAVDDLQTSYPEIWDLIEKGYWVNALEEAKKNSTESQTVVIDNKNSLTNEQKKKITKVATTNGFVVEFTDNNTKITLTAEDKGTVALIGELINHLDNKKYLSNNREVDYNDDTGVDVAESVVDEFITRNNLNDKLDDSGISIFKDICVDKGFNVGDNPLLAFVYDINLDTKLNGEQLTALYQLVTDNVINNRDFENKGGTVLDNIVRNKGLYARNIKQNDVYSLIKKYFETKDERTKERFFDSQGHVRKWSQIKNELSLSDDTPKEYGRLRKNASNKAVDDWVDSLDDDMRERIARSIETYGVSHY